MSVLGWLAFIVVYFQEKPIEITQWGDCVGTWFSDSTGILWMCKLVTVLLTMANMAPATKEVISTPLADTQLLHWASCAHAG